MAKKGKCITLDESVLNQIELLAKRHQRNFSNMIEIIAKFYLDYEQCPGSLQSVALTKQEIKKEMKKTADLNEKEEELEKKAEVTEDTSSSSILNHLTHNFGIKAN